MLKPITEKKGTFAKVRFDNKKVIKTYIPTSEDVVSSTESKHKEYCTTLRKLGITIPDFETDSDPIVRYNIRYKLAIIQDRLSEDRFLLNLLKSKPKEALDAIDKLIDICLKIYNHNLNSEQIIGLDTSFKNIAYENGQLVLVDTFPPIMISRNEYLKTIKQFLPTYLQPFTKFSNDHFNIIQQITRIFFNTLRYNPELEELIKKIIINKIDTLPTNIKLKIIANMNQKKRLDLKRRLTDILLRRSN